MDLHPVIEAFASGPALEIVEGERFWAVVYDRGDYVAAWLDANGDLHTKAFFTQARAENKARKEWGT